MKNYFALTVNSAYWICYYTLVISVFFFAARFTNAPTSKVIWLMITGLFILPSTLSFYSMYFAVFPKYINQGKWLKGSLVSLAASIPAAIVGFVFLFFIAPVSNFGHGNTETKVGVFITLFVIALVNQLMAWVIRGFITWQKEFKLKAELKHQNLESQLALIRSKMDPHFLFNSLNNIDVMIQDNPIKGSEYLNKLSDIIRFMLYETQLDKISLVKELDYLKKYIELQKIRSENENFVTLIIEGSAEDKHIPPVIFIPFVENAFKHCNNKKASGAVDVRVKTEATKIEFTCSNTIGKATEKKSKPLGNKLIKERLKLVLPGAHQLEIKQVENRYWVNLSLDV